MKNSLNIATICSSNQAAIQGFPTLPHGATGATLRAICLNSIKSFLRWANFVQDS